MEDGHRRRLCFVATVPFAFNVFMRSHIELLKNDFDITLVANGEPEELQNLIDDRVDFVSMPIERKISLTKDALALIKLWRFFLINDFDVVCSLLPKSGLLAMIAARLASVPVRMNIFNGEVWANDQGLMRQLLKFTDRVIVRCATKLLAVSPSQRDFLVANRIVDSQKIDVVANGSITGVDEVRFRPNLTERIRIRLIHSIPKDAVVFLFLGRLNLDKGVIDLFKAFSLVAQKNNSHHLMIVGPDEDGLDGEFWKLAHDFPGRIHRVGFTLSPEVYMASADVICLPSYREGFGMVLIEAASVGLPAIASGIYGVCDAVEDGVTGILHKPGDIQDIAHSILQLGGDEEMRKRMSTFARKRVKEKFSKDYVTRSFADYYAVALARPKRLLIVVNSALSFLSHRLPVALAAKNMGYEVHVATSPGQGIEDIKSVGLIHHSVPLTRSGMNVILEIRTIAALLKLFFKIRPEIVHLVTIKPVLYGGLAARIARVPSVVAAISGLGFVFMNSATKVKFVRFFVVLLYRLVLNKKNLKVIFQNPDDCNAILQYVSLDLEKIVMIKGSGVDLSRFDLRPLPSGIPVVVMASRLLRDKGVNEFLEAVQLLKTRGVIARYWLVGSSDPGNPTSIDFGELIKKCEAMRVDLLGQRQDIADLFAQSHVVVLPSYREGLPKVLLEAAACGRVVVTTDVPGCKHAVEAGSTGLLVPPYDPVSLADAIEGLISNKYLCRQMGLAGRKMAEREFSIEKVVASHMCIYEKLLENIK